MNRRNFFKTVTGFVAGVMSMPSVLCAKKKPKNTLTLHVDTDREVTDEWQPCCASSSTNSVNYMVKIIYWDKDEPDIYTFKDGVPIS